MLRRLFKFFLFLLILIAIAAIAITVALRTDYPRQLVIAQLQKQIGLRVEASEFHTGWGGHAVLRDVKLSLPLAEQSFLEVPEMRVEHTPVAWLILMRHAEVNFVSL